MSKIITLYINSKDRDSNSISNTNFRYLLYPLGISNCQNYYVTSATIPLSDYVTVYPPKDGTGSQSFVLNDSVGIHSGTIAMGNYPASILANLLQTELNAIGQGGYSVSYSSYTNLFSITNATSFAIAWSSNNASYPYQSLGVLLGWRDIFYNPVNIPNTTSVVAPFETNLSGPLQFYILSQCLTTNTNSFFQGKKSSVISAIPNNVEPFGILTYQNSSPIYWNPLNSIKIDQIDLRLVDEFGVDVILNADWDISITFQCDS